MSDTVADTPQMSQPQALNVLELGDDATMVDIRRAYKRLAMKYHPDKNPRGEEHFKIVNVAYEVMCEAYDERTLSRSTFASCQTETEQPPSCGDNTVKSDHADGNKGDTRAEDKPIPHSDNPRRQEEHDEDEDTPAPCAPPELDTPVTYQNNRTRVHSGMGFRVMFGIYAICNDSAVACRETDQACAEWCVPADIVASMCEAVRVRLRSQHAVLGQAILWTSVFKHFDTVRACIAQLQVYAVNTRGSSPVVKIRLGADEANVAGILKLITKFIRFAKFPPEILYRSTLLAPEHVSEQITSLACGGIVHLYRWVDEAHRPGSAAARDGSRFPAFLKRDIPVIFEARHVQLRLVTRTKSNAAHIHEVPLPIAISCMREMRHAAAQLLLPPHLVRACTILHKALVLLCNHQHMVKVLEVSMDKDASDGFLRWLRAECAGRAQDEKDASAVTRVKLQDTMDCTVKIGFVLREQV